MELNRQSPVEQETEAGSSGGRVPHRWWFLVSALAAASALVLAMGVSDRESAAGVALPSAAIAPQRQAPSALDVFSPATGQTVCSCAPSADGGQPPPAPRIPSDRILSDQEIEQIEAARLQIDQERVEFVRSIVELPPTERRAELETWYRASRTDRLALSRFERQLRRQRRNSAQ